MDDVKLVLVGNKLDLEQHRQVTTHKGEKVQCFSACAVHAAEKCDATMYYCAAG